MDVRGHYRDAITSSLGGFQLLEESLKVYLDLYYKSVRHLLSGRLFFDHQRRDIDEAPLGRLVNAFSKTCGNAELIEALRALVKHRDHAAHRAFMRLYDDSVTDDELHVLVREAHELRTELQQTLRAVQDEIHKMNRSIFGVVK